MSTTKPCSTSKKILWRDTLYKGVIDFFFANPFPILFTHTVKFYLLKNGFQPLFLSKPLLTIVTGPLRYKQWDAAFEKSVLQPLVSLLGKPEQVVIIIIFLQCESICDGVSVNIDKIEKRLWTLNGCYCTSRRCYNKPESHSHWPIP